MEAGPLLDTVVYWSNHNSRVLAKVESAALECPGPMEVEGQEAGRLMQQLRDQAPLNEEQLQSVCITAQDFKVRVE